MKNVRFVCLIVLLLLSQLGFSQKLSIKNLTGNFYIYTTYNDYGGKPFPANGLYLVTAEGVVLIDSPWDATQCQPLLDTIEKRHHKKPLLCIATHSHADRTGGFDYFRSKGIKTFASTQTAKLCRKNKEQRPEFTFSKDTIFNIGGHQVETFYPGKGHTSDNIVIWFANDKILYGGCFIKSTESQGLGNVADADVKAWPKSICKMLQKFPNPDYVIPGHQSWADKKSLEYTLQLLRK